MLIGIDGNEANQKRRVGIGQVAFNVLLRLEKIDKKNKYIIYLKDQPLLDLPKEREGWRYKVFGPKKLWTQVALPIRLFTQREKLDLFFTPSHYAPRFSPFPTVIYIMDLWHHRHPEQFSSRDLYQLTKWESYSIKNAKHVLTISEFSKSEIMNIYHLSEDKVTVAYPGFDRFEIKNQMSKTKAIMKKYKINGDYLLYIGTLQPKKNLVRLVEAFGEVKKKYPQILLVLAGKRGWLYDEIFAKVKELGMEDKVIFTGFIDEEDKAPLLAGAKAFVFPSLYEGFGIPVLEAMSLRTPAVVAKAGSLPEVGGDAAIYCDPYSIESISKAIEKALGLNKKERDAIIARGMRQTEKFSWEKCAREVLETFALITDNQ